jgi:tRNA threonylcarbamoyl adenosine modification protein (Sua5/YciO/YrdC/YwlC family)
MLNGMARYVDVHPRNPQPRSIAQVAELLRDGALIAYPTDSCYALGCAVDSPTGADRMRRIRHLDPHHHFTLVCANFGQLGEYVQLGNAAFRAIKAATPGPYTFILRATREVPRRFAEPKKRTVGVRIPNHPVVRALLEELGAPLVSTTLLLPGATEPMTDGWMIKEELDHVVDVVIDAGECGREPSTVVNWADGYPEVVRVGAGDVARFEA